MKASLLAKIAMALLALTLIGSHVAHLFTDEHRAAEIQRGKDKRLPYQWMVTGVNYGILNHASELRTNLVSVQLARTDVSKESPVRAPVTVVDSHPDYAFYANRRVGDRVQYRERPSLANQAKDGIQPACLQELQPYEVPK